MSSGKSICGSLLCLLVVLGVSCKDEVREPTLPSDEILVNLLCDLHLAESTLNRIHIERQDSVSLKIRERIAQSYGVSPAQLDIWLESLQRSPEHSVSIYDSVIVELERRVMDVDN